MNDVPWWVAYVSFPIVSGVVYTVIAFFVLRRWQRQPPTAEEVARARIAVEHEMDDAKDITAGQLQEFFARIGRQAQGDHATGTAGELPPEGFEQPIIDTCQEIRSELGRVRRILRRDDLADASEEAVGIILKEYAEAAAGLAIVRGQVARGEVASDGSLTNLIRQRIGRLPHVANVAGGQSDNFKTIRPRRGYKGRPGV